MFKDPKNTVEWTKWKHQDRSRIILDKINELALPWVEERVVSGELQQDRSELSTSFVEEELTRAFRTESAPGLGRVDYKMLTSLPAK